MKAVIQRVDGAVLSVADREVARIGVGLVIYLGIEQGDTFSDVKKFCQKVAAMRIFSDPDGKMNLSVCDVSGSVLLVSNFTLCADISHGNRPSFTAAMRPVSDASALFDRAVVELNSLVPTKSGIFGADMTIEQSNAGPVTIVY